MAKALIGDREVRFERIALDLAVGLDLEDFGYMHLVQDEDYRLVLVSPETWEIVGLDADRLGDLLLFSKLVSHGRESLPTYMLTPKHSPNDYPPRDYLADLDVEVNYCLAAPSCLQDVIHRERGFPICAYHDAQMWDVDALLTLG